MLQVVIYYIITVILTKELVIATDNCTEYQFKTPFSYVGESCEDIYNKNTKSHKWPGYYTIAYKIYCGMSSYTGSSCENIFKKYPEIHRINPKEKSGYYRLNNSQWTYCDMSDIAVGAADFISMCSVVEVGESRMKSTNYNYQSFLPGISCENIYNSNKGSHNSPGYYWTRRRVYCGMNYTGSSCVDIYDSSPETQNKSGYYRLRQNNISISGHIVTCQQFKVVVTSSLHVLVWEEDGEELLILTSVQEMIVRVSGGRPHNLMLASVEWPVMIVTHVLLPISLLME